MKKYLPFFMLLLLFAVPVSAQDDPLVNLTIGGGILGVDTGVSVEGAAGLLVDINFNIDDNIGLFFSLGYHETFNIDAAVYESLGGVRYFMRNDGDTTFFAHVMGGDVEVDAFGIGSSWALGGGIGLDKKLGGKFDFRVFQVDYIASFFQGSVQNNLRVSTGITFNFGSR